MWRFEVFHLYKGNTHARSNNASTDVGQIRAIDSLDCERIFSPGSFDQKHQNDDVEIGIKIPPVQGETTSEKSTLISTPQLNLLKKPAMLLPN
jgi:hypothetical protein